MRAMKDSGVEWVQRIPSEWETKRLKYIAECNTDVLSENTDEDEQIKYIDIGSVTYEKGIEQIQEFRFSDSPSRARRIIKSGDTIISTVRTYLKAIAYIDQMYDGNICSTGFAVLRAKAECNPKFLYYALCAEWFISMVEAYSTGISYPAITSTALCSLPVIMPQSREQQRIANFLDTKCAQIDAIIEKQQQVIEKLKAYKQSVITEVVTKGLDPTVPMKDSGVEWIGKVPEKAMVTHVGRLFRTILGKMLCDKQPSEDATLEAYYCAGNVHFDGIDSDNLKQMWFTPSEKHDYLVHEGDLLVVEGGAGAGGSYIADKTETAVYVQNSIHVVRPLDKKANNKFLYYTIFSLVGRSYIDFVCNKATIPHFTKEKLRNVPVVLFSEEQTGEIVEYLDVRCNAIDNAIKKKSAAITKLTDYKKSLIYEAVTGKMEV